MVLLRLITIYISLIIGQILFAQKQYVFEHISTSEGLSHGSVSSMIKDKKGFMWFSTWDGINRYDGYEFKVFKLEGDEARSVSNRFEKIVEDRYGNIWARSYDGNIFRFDTDKHMFEHIPGSAFDTVAYTINNIQMMPSGEVWLITQSRGVFRVSTDSITNSISVNHITNGNLFSLPGGKINKILKDKREQTWILTNKGVKVFKRSSDSDILTTKQLSPVFEKMLGSEDVVSYAFTEKEILLGTKSGKLISYNEESETLERLYLENNHPISDIIVTTNGVIYVSTTGNGIFEFTIWKKKVTSHFSSNTLDHTLKMYADSKGLLWIESMKPGVSMINLDTKKHFHFTQELDVALDLRANPQIGLIEEENNIWITFKGGGFGYYNYQSGKMNYFFNKPGDPNRQFSNFVNCFYKDKEGVLWLSTYFKGLEKIIPREHQFDFIQPAPLSKYSIANEVRALLNDAKNQLWVATKNEEVFILDKNYTIIKSFKKISNHAIGRVYAIMEDVSGNIFLGTKGNGLFVLTPANNNDYKVKHFQKIPGDTNSLSSNNIYAIHQDRKGIIWIATYGGGINIFKDDFFYKPFSKDLGSGQKVRCIHEDFKGNLWFGTTTGILFVDRSKNELSESACQFLNNTRGNINLAGNDVFYIASDSQNHIWVTTLGGGLSRLVDYPTGEKFESIHVDHISKSDGLPSDMIYTLHEDDIGNIWMSSGNGIAFYNISEKKIRNFTSISAIENSVFSEGAITIMKDGRLVFGANNGFYVFAPETFVKQKKKVRLAFTEFYLFDIPVNPVDSDILEKNINETQTIHLTHDQNMFSIQWAGLSYNTTDVAYSYKLEGYDHEWIRSKGQHIAKYAKVPFGNYTFKVKINDSELHASDNYRILSIIVEPPFWLTNWAFVIYGVLLIVIIIIFRHIAITIIRLRNKVIIEKEVSEVKINFFTNISHELRTPLTLIQGPLHEIKKTEHLSKKGNSYLQLIEDNSSRLLKLVNQLLDFRKIQSKAMKLNLSRVDMNMLIEKTAANFKEEALKKSIQFNVSVPHQQLALVVDDEKISTVLINLISNAIKFTPENGQIKIIAKVNSIEKTFEIKVSDTGPGVDAEQEDYLFHPFVSMLGKKEGMSKGTGIGLAFAKEIVELHKGRIIFRNRKSGGASFIVELPLIKIDSQPEKERINESDFLETNPSEYKRIKENPVEAENYNLLIVDDNEELLNFLNLNLSDGYTISEAKDGKEGVDKARKLKPDIILSDIMMPVMDGIQMLDILKNDEDLCHIPVVLLSAKASVDSKIQGLRYGADAYLTKPFNTEQLKAQLNNLLKQRLVLRNAFLSKSSEEIHLEGIQLTSVDEVFLTTVRQTIEDNLSNTSFRVDDLYAATNMGRSKFSYKLKGLTGLSPIDFIKEFRLSKALILLKTGKYNVSEVSYMSGYSDAGYFSKSFKDQYGYSPSENIKK